MHFASKIFFFLSLFFFAEKAIDFCCEKRLMQTLSMQPHTQTKVIHLIGFVSCVTLRNVAATNNISNTSLSLQICSSQRKQQQQQQLYPMRFEWGQSGHVCLREPTFILAASKSAFIRGSFERNSLLLLFCNLLLATAIHFCSMHLQ